MFSFLCQPPIQNNVDLDLHFSTERTQLKMFACIRQLIEKLRLLNGSQGDICEYLLLSLRTRNFDRANCKRSMSPHWVSSQMHEITRAGVLLLSIHKIHAYVTAIFRWTYSGNGHRYIFVERFMRRFKNDTYTITVTEQFLILTVARQDAKSCLNSHHSPTYIFPFLPFCTSKILSSDSFDAVVHLFAKKSKKLQIAMKRSYQDTTIEKREKRM